mgnify:CR=1 FL=1
MDALGEPWRRPGPRPPGQAAAAAEAPLVDGPALFLERGVDIGFWTDQVHPDRPGHLLLGEGLFEALKDQGP